MISLRNLTRFRVSLNQQLTDSKRRIISILDQIFPEFESLFSDVFGKTAKAILSNHPTPDELNDLSLRKLTNLVSKFSRGRFAKAKAQEIKESAATSFGVSFAMDSFTLQLKLLLNQLDFLKEQLTNLDSEIDKSMKKVDSVLITIPGIGTTLAASIHAEIGDIKRFSSYNQLVSFAGIDPTVRQSGNFVGNKNRMSKRGSPYLRLALWQAAILSIRFNPILKEYYNKKIKEGKHHMTAIGATTNKLTRIIFSMLKENKKYVA